MPIRIENKHRYPRDWTRISRATKERAGWRCEGTPQFPDCRARHGEPHPITGAKVVLTVAHLDHQPENNDPRNLRALCQRCHNAWDARSRAQGIAARRRTERACGDLFAAQLDGKRIADPIGRAILWPYGFGGDDDC
ncbi:MAG TPA: hypothetical protein VFA57_00350 [Pseudolabrys sp.]|nr:hypothetical protein [Pseudolabrys sp.]